MEKGFSRLILQLLQHGTVEHLTANVPPVTIGTAHGVVAVAYAEVAQKLLMCLHILSARPLEGSGIGSRLNGKTIKHLILGTGSEACRQQDNHHP